MNMSLYYVTRMKSTRCGKRQKTRRSAHVRQQSNPLVKRWSRCHIDTTQWLYRLSKLRSLPQVQTSCSPETPRSGDRDACHYPWPWSNGVWHTISLVSNVYQVVGTVYHGSVWEKWSVMYPMQFPTTHIMHEHTILMLEKYATIPHAHFVC